MLAGTKTEWKGLFMFCVQHPIQQEGLFIQLSGRCAYTHEELWELKSSTGIPDPQNWCLHWECDLFLIDYLLHARYIAIFCILL